MIISRIIWNNILCNKYNLLHKLSIISISTMDKLNLVTYVVEGII